MDGWIKLHRQVADNPLWTCEKFTRGQAWIDLLILANHKDGFFYSRGIKVVVKRGQVGWSGIRLSERWSWSRSKVKKFLNDLEKEQQIIQQKDNVTQVITLINYDYYQSKEQQTEQQKDSKRTAEVQQKDTNKNDKKEKNVNNDKNNKPKGFNFDFINNLELNGQTEKFIKIFKEYIDYRKEIKKPYKSQRSLEVGFKQLLEKSNNNIADAEKMIENTIANGWTGLIELKQNNNNSNNPNEAYKIEKTDYGDTKNGGLIKLR